MGFLVTLYVENDLDACELIKATVADGNDKFILLETEDAGPNSHILAKHYASRSISEEDV